MRRLARYPEVHRNLSRRFILTDRGIEAQQRDRELAIERVGITDGGAASSCNGIEVRLQASAALVVEHGALNNPSVEARVIRSQAQSERAGAINEARLVTPEGSQLGATEATRGLAGDRGGIDFPASQGHGDVGHFAHCEKARIAHLNVIGRAGSIGSTRASVAIKRKRGAATGSRNANLVGSWARRDVVNRASSKLAVKVGSAFLGEDNRVANTEIRAGGNADQRKGGRRDGKGKVGEVLEARKGAGRFHGDHAVLAGQDGGLAAVGDGHRGRRPVAG